MTGGEDHALGRVEQPRPDASAARRAVQIELVDFTAAGHRETCDGAGSHGDDRVGDAIAGAFRE
jgi:hypothetical protein